MYTYIEYKRREFKTDVGRNQAHDQTFTGSLGRGGSRCEMLIKDNGNSWDILGLKPSHTP